MGSEGKPAVLDGEELGSDGIEGADEGEEDDGLGSEGAEGEEGEEGDELGIEGIEGIDEELLELEVVSHPARIRPRAETAMQAVSGLRVWNWLIVLPPRLHKT